MTNATQTTRAEKARRSSMSFDAQMREAEESCPPCKLCGGKAEIKDAGSGWGYYIGCSNSDFAMAQGRATCLQSGTRLSGWAYNVADMWTRLNAANE
jgi:hypothetical protein